MIIVEKKYNTKNMTSKSWTFDTWSYMKIVPYGRKWLMVKKSPPL